MSRQGGDETGPPKEETASIAVVNVSLTLKLILSFFSVALLIGSLSHAGLAKKKHPISPSAPNSTLIQRIFADGMPSVCRRPILLLNMHFCDR